MSIQNTDKALDLFRTHAFRLVPERPAPASLGLQDLVAEMLELLPAKLTFSPHFDAWAELLQTTLGESLNDLAIARSRLNETYEEAPEQEEHAVVDWMPANEAEVHVLHQFTEDEMDVIDALITEVKDRMRRHANHRLFEGEEILAAWLDEAGVTLPQVLPSIGERSQGGYFMHMSGDAQQSAHIHGVMRKDGTTVAGTGGRFLVGLFGAHGSTIRHAGGVIRVPRGALAIIHFPQNEHGATTHQFWNEDDEPGVGNLIFSFHGVDIVPQDAASAEVGSEMMSKRTYNISEKAAAAHPNHGFLF